MDGGSVKVQVRDANCVVDGGSKTHPKGLPISSDDGLVVVGPAAFQQHVGLFILLITWDDANADADAR